MKVLYFLKGGKADSFNCVNIELKLEDLKKLEIVFLPGLGINRKYDKRNKYFKLIEMIRELLLQGKFIYYTSWW